MLELEKTYLVKTLPSLEGLHRKEIHDIYFPVQSEHPTLRVRKNGDTFEMTKKDPVRDGDASAHIEHTIHLTKTEFEAIRNVEGKGVRKWRYYYPYDDLTGEIDVFQDDLTGLILADFEFQTEEEKDVFIMPDFCLAEVTQEEFLAGGMLCGKTYLDIVDDLKRFHYSKLLV